MYFTVRKLVQRKIGRRFCGLYTIENICSEQNITQTITKLKTMRPINMETAPVKKAAVLIPLCVVDGKISLLYTLRTSHLRSHKGQVSFPGGMQDTKDADLINTALRETKEELGIDDDRIRVWGAGSLINARGTCILPVVGQIADEFDLIELSANPHEVEEVFTVAIEDLCDPNKIGYTQFKGAYSTPVFMGGRRKIWGLTAIITNIFLKSLLPNKAYYHRIQFIPAVKPVSVADVT